MSQLSSTLREAADKNHELLTELAATDYAPASSKQNTAFIEDLQKQIKNLDTELKRLHGITEDERKDHISYRDSNVKRWMYKVQGSKGKDKFSSKREKEEREFLEAWQNERSAQESRDELARTLARAEEDRKHLAVDAERQAKAQKELDEMYHSIFSGPTPEVPGEDQAEDVVNAAKSFLEQAQKILNDDRMAMKYLEKCRQCMSTANYQMDDALKYSTVDQFGGGTFVDMMERDALAQSQEFVNITIRHLDTARRYQPEIGQLGQIQIDHGHFFSDVMFDNIFTDMRQHARIEKAKAEMVQATKGLERQVQMQGERLRDSGTRHKQAGDRLEAARKELQRIRAEAFAALASSEAPPAYAA